MLEGKKKSNKELWKAHKLNFTAMFILTLTFFEKWNIFQKKKILKNYLIFLYLVTTLKWVEKLSLDFPYLA